MWGSLCGWYAPDAGSVTNSFQRLTMGAGLEVAVRQGRLVMTPLTPIPAMRATMELHSDDPDDPRVFRVVMPDYGRTDRVVFTDDTPPPAWERSPPPHTSDGRFDDHHGGASELTTSAASMGVECAASGGRRVRCTSTGGPRGASSSVRSASP